MKRIKVIAGLFAMMILSMNTLPMHAHAAVHENGVKYQCPMHPSFIADKPGECAICGMKLVKVNTTQESPKESTKNKILFYRHPMRPNVSSPVPAKDEMGMDYIPVYKDENNSEDSDSQCYFHECPMIKRGQPCPMLILASKGEKVECPVCKESIELFVKQRTLAAKEGYASVLITEEKQRIIGITTELVQKKNTGKVIRAAGEIMESDKNPLYMLPKGQALVYANIYEHDAPLVKFGQSVWIEVPGAFGSKIDGRIQYIDTVPNKRTHLFKVRASIPNPKGLLKPGMPVSVSIKLSLDEMLSVPEAAVFLAKDVNMVFVDKGKGLFEPRPVILGQKTQGSYEVKEGLKEGERVITNGHFLVDSESRLKAALNAMAGQKEEGRKS